MNYPYSPGYKTGGTSKESAEKIKPHAKAVREQVAQVYQHSFTLAGTRTEYTADEVASFLGLSILTIRPRVTELTKLGKLVDTGKRRKNASGHMAKVLKWAEAGDEQPKLF